MRGILLQSRVGSLLIESRKPPGMKAGIDKGSDTDPFTDLDKDEDQPEVNLAPWVQLACAKASVFALV